MTKAKKKIRWKIVLPVIALILVLLYIILVNFLVSAALIPSFMEKLTLFETITEQSLDQQVHSDDIESNIAHAQSAYEEWLATVDMHTETVVTEDGYTLVGTVMAADEDSHLWALVLHGYTGWKEEMYSYAKLYQRRGFNCIVPDLRAQGESEGDYIGMGWTDHYDCMLWIDRILEIDPEAEIVIHGQSMGAATALMMTGEESLSDHVKAVVSDCAYTDAYTMFGNKLTEWFGLPAFPFIDTAVLMLKLRGGYDLRDASAINAVRQSTTPTLFIHGDQDAMISVEMCYELYDAAACDKEILIVEGAGHAQSNPKDPAAYNGTLFSFISQYLDGYTYEQ